MSIGLPENKDKKTLSTLYFNNKIWTKKNVLLAVSTAFVQLTTYNNNVC